MESLLHLLSLYDKLTVETGLHIAGYFCISPHKPWNSLSPWFVYSSRALVWLQIRCVLRIKRGLTLHYHSKSCDLTWYIWCVLPTKELAVLLWKGFLNNTYSSHWIFLACGKDFCLPYKLFLGCMIGWPANRRKCNTSLSSICKRSRTTRLITVLP